MRRALLVLCLALALLAPSVRAQSETGIAITVSPSEAQATPGTAFFTVVTVANREMRPLIVNLEADVHSNLNVTWQSKQLNVPPQSTASTQVAFSSDEVGNHSASVYARDWTPVAGNGTFYANATFRLRVFVFSNGTQAPTNETLPGGNSTQNPGGNMTGGNLTGGNSTGNATHGGNSTTGGGNATMGGNSTSPGGNATMPGNQTATGPNQTMPAPDQPEDPSPDRLWPNGTENPPSTPPRNESTGPPPPRQEGGDVLWASSTGGEPAAAAPPPPPAPVVRPGELDLSARPETGARFAIAVQNTGDAAQSFEASLALPRGWSGSLATARLEVPARGERTLGGSVAPGPDAEDGEARVLVTGPGGAAETLLRLRVDRPAPAATPTPEALTTLDAAESAPPTAAAQETRAERAPPARPGKETEPTTRTEPEAPRLRVEPARVELAPGGRATARLVVTNPGATPLTAKAAVQVPDGFSATLLQEEWTVAAGGSISLPLRIEASGTLAEGGEHHAAASAEGLADAAEFTLVVVPGQPVAEGRIEEAPGRERVLFALAMAGVGTTVLVGAAAAQGGATLRSEGRARRLLDALRGGFAYALYTRLRPGRALDHPTRQRLLDVVQKEPGLPLGEVQRRLALPNGTLRHHLRFLEQSGNVRSVQDGQHRRLYPAGAGRVAPTPLLSERALDALRAVGPMPAARLAQRLGVSKQALHYHVKKLLGRGALSAERRGAEVVLHLVVEETGATPSRARP